jgi:apolipoprotein D and lipocalin family protein
MKSIFSILAAVLTACATTSAKDAPELKTVPYVDLNRYIGSWYEIARLPNRFQRDCLRAIATYSIREDGDIGVYNKCYLTPDDKKTDDIKGMAWVEDKETNSKLRVRFFWPFSARYWIIDLAEDYSYAVVSEPKKRVLWILSRTKEMDAEVYAGIIDRLKKYGYDLSDLIVADWSNFKD